MSLNPLLDEPVGAVRPFAASAYQDFLLTAVLEDDLHFRVVLKKNILQAVQVVVDQGLPAGLGNQGVGIQVVPDVGVTTTAGSGTSYGGSFRFAVTVFCWVISAPDYWARPCLVG